MNRVPVIPENAPFSTEQRAWLNGYLAGLFSHVPVVVASADPPAASGKSLLILYGSQTGSAEQLAKRIGTDSKTHSHNARVMELNACPVANLANEEHVLIVTSTWGDGDPPDNAAQFWSQLSAADAPKLPQLNYAVLALGDRNYSDFCGAGKKFDTRLEGLGAKRILERAECDTDYEATARAWIGNLWAKLDGAASATVSTSKSEPAPKRKTFDARLILSRNLNLPGSSKETRHVEISLKDSGLTYEVGDALGVVPANCPELVAEMLAALKCDGEEAVKSPQGDELPLRKALLTSYQITQIPPPLLREFAERSKNDKLRTLLEPTRKPDLDKYLYGREIIDLFLMYPNVTFAPAEFVAFLRKLQPRLYSISSSPKAHPGEVHLTVGAVRYESYGRKRKGVCSTFLADRASAETPLPVFVQTSHGFRLPADTQRPVIMIGPGTGLAPFRAFLEERQAAGARGKNWLFFGDQCAATDFLYRDQLEAMRTHGILTRMDTAFSRDQAEKIYVQHRIEQSAAELWSWLEEGAHVYVCGDAKRMARDVEAALLKVVEKAGERSGEQAVEYLQKLKSEKRYQRDVY